MLLLKQKQAPSIQNNIYMLTQIPGFSTTSLNELTLSLTEFDQLMNDALNCSNPVGAIYTSTVQLLRYAFWLGEQEAKLAKQEFKKLLDIIGWKKEAKRYLDISKAFRGFLPEELAQVEPHTIFRIAGNLNKYKFVITQIAILAQITQDAVRGFIKQCRKPRAAKIEEEPSIWRTAPDNGRVFQAPPMYDEVTGVIIEEIMKAEGRTAQSILAEAVALLKDKKDGKLVYIEEVIAQELQTVSESSPASFDDTFDLNDDNISVVEAPFEEVWYNDEELVVEDTWASVEVENADEIEDYKFVNSENSQKEEKNSVNLLIETYQSATSCDEINEVLNLYGEFEQQAWYSLTLLERRRAIEIMSS
ncbi:hypothetical protein RIVM261_068810 [Rivularia sp. IAM M-261]|nr:hypothetical protein CAL7716_040400 [Calothrix sp. PCC 7716]GJD21925.1 hypothetical protein RIVM261_068810 [Rivularia sp. IAM M-261]